MSSPLQKKLMAAKAVFASAKDNVASGKVGDFFTPEPGRLKVQITDGEVNESQSGRLQCFFALTILEGEHAGESFRKYYGIDDKGMEFLLKDLQRLESDLPDDISLLEDTIAAIVKQAPMLNVRVKEKGEFLNTYFDKLIKGEDAAQYTTAQAPTRTETPVQTAPEPVAAQAPEPTPTQEPTTEGSNDDICEGKRLMVEGYGLGDVLAIDEEKGLVTLKLITGKVATVEADKLSLPPIVAPKPALMRVGKK